MTRLFFILLGSTAAASPLAAQEMASLDGVRLADADQPILVIGRRDQPTTVRSATRTDTPLKDVPQAISIVTAERIGEQGLRSISDVLRTVPGATVASGEGHRDQILLRGQNSTADFFVDGLRDDVQYYRGLYNLDRVEVLKGPNAMIFGRGGGGGVVNRVTKKAEAQRFASGAVSIDSHGAWSTAADANAPLGDSAALRLNAVRETFDSFRDHVDGRRTGINPTLGWDVGAATRLDLGYEYSRDRRVVDRGIPSRNGRPLAAARDRFFGDAAVNRTAFDAHVADVALSHALSDTIDWTAKARFGTYDKYYANALAATAVTAADTVGIEAYRSTSKRDALLVQNDLVATLATGGVAHRLLAGIDYGRQDSFSDRQQGFFDSAGTVQRRFVPVASSDRLPPILFRDSPSRRATAADTLATSWGVYVQDQAKIGEHFEILAGLRRDWFSLDYADRLSAARLKRSDSLWSPRLGLVVKPSAKLSLYASWSKSFLPQSGDQFSSLTPSTAALAPEKFVNREIGLKHSFTPRLALTLAGYILDRDNTRANDPVTGQAVLTGKQRSKGVEASLEGKLGDRLSLTAGAALQDAEIRRDTTAAPAGRKIASVPRFTASLWARHDVSDRLGVALGVHHQSNSFASISNAVVVPAYTRLDAAAFVAINPRLAFQFNVENLLDSKYIALSHTDNNLTPGAPRTARATLRLGL